jgi:hypothetical protein
MIQWGKYASHIYQKGQAGQLLSAEQDATNRKHSKVRSRVGHVLVFRQHSIGGKHIYTIRLVPDEFKIGLRNLTYDLMRYQWLSKRREGKPTAAWKEQWAAQKAPRESKSRQTCAISTVIHQLAVGAFQITNITPQQIQLHAYCVFRRRWPPIPGNVTDVHIE